MGPRSLISVGYEGRSAQELVDEVAESGATVLVDVRQTPLSRKPGLSKRKLADALAERGIRYLHLRALGNPKENRASFRTGDPLSIAAFRHLLGGEAGTAALGELADLVQNETVALLCFERDHAACHRHVVVEELQRVRPAALDLALL